jgi:3-hydroxy acid dehydrogenase/malonic semialdehyde reductase
MILLVTGASAGFGAVIARRFVADGATVIGAARRGDRLAAMQNELGSAFHPLTFDIRDRPSVEAALASLPAELAEIDVLINNAGLALGIGPAQNASIEDWEAMVDTNIKGLLSVTRFLLPGMVARNRGHIVNLGSVAGEWPYPGGNVYGGTKAFVHQFSNNLRADLFGTAVRVTNIEPGMVGGTEFSTVRLGDTDKASAVYQGADPLTPEDIADTVHWVVSRPPRVNINVVQLMPVCQAYGPLAIKRNSGT